MSIPRGHVQLETKQPPLKLLVRLGQGDITITDGYGGWTIVRRPRRVGLTIWEGRNPYKLRLPIIIDGYKKDDPVEVKCSALERMALPSQQGAEPPTVKVEGPGQSLPHEDLTWVVENIEWGTTIRRREDGRRLRQEAVVLLLGYQAVDKINPVKKAQSKGAASKGKAGGGSKVYVVKKGDTLSAIAARQLGSSSKWQQIAKLNNIRDPKSIKPGQKLRMP